MSSLLEFLLMLRGHTPLEVCIDPAFQVLHSVVRWYILHFYVVIQRFYVVILIIDCML